MAFCRVFSEGAETPPIFTEAVVCEVLSPSRRLKAVFRKAEETKDDDLWLEIWDGHKMLLVKDLKKEHGGMTPGAVMGVPRWNTDEDMLVYTAEPVPTKKSSFWSEDAAGNEYDYIQNFGETLTKVRAPQLFVFNISSQEVTKLDTPNFHPMTPCFKPGSSDIAYVGLKNTPLL